MFKKLREKLADEVRQSPLRMPGTFTFGNPTLQAVGETKDQEFPGDGLSNEQQFSITEDDGTSSEMGSPQRDLNTAASSSKASDDLDSSLFSPVLDNFQSASRSTYIPPSDLESEVEDRIQTPPTLDDSITKEQLFLALTKLHARVQRYKTKYSKVAEACKTANNEKEKILKTLASNQDQMLRRMSELKEQCHLEKQAKAHLEENLRLMLDEKEDMIGVLKTKIDLLKGGQNPDLIDEDVKSTKSIDSFSISEDQDCDKKSVRSQDDNSATSKDSESTTVLENKVKRLEELLSRCKNALQSNKERSEQLTLERDRLADQLEKKERELLKIQEDESAIQSNLRTELSEMSERLIKLRKEQEEMGMAMAETKRSFHQELETREQRLADTQKDLNKAKEDINKIQQQWHDESIKVQNLTAELEKMGKTLEEEKNELIQKLSESKSAAIKLLKEQHEKSLKETEDEWKIKVEEAEKKYLALVEIEKENSSKLRENNSFVERLKEETNVTVSELNEKIATLTDELSLKKNQGLSEQTNLQDEIRSLKTQLEDTKRSYDQSIIDFNKLKEENETLVSSHDEITRKYLELERERDNHALDASNELERVKSEKKQLEDEITKLNSDAESLTARINELECSSVTLNNFIDNSLGLFNNFDGSLKLDKNSLEECGSKLKSALDRITSENSKQKELLDEIRLEKDAVESRLNEAQSELENKSKIIEQLQRDVDTLKSTSGNLEEIQTQLIASQTEINNLREELNESRTRIEKSTQDYEKLRFKYDETVSCNECKEIEMKKELESQRSALIDKENHVAILSERCSAFEKEILNLKSNLEAKDNNLAEIETKFGNELRCLKTENEKLLSELTELNETNQKSIDNNAVEFQKLMKELEALEKRKAEFESEISDLKNSLENEKLVANKASSELQSAISERDKLVKAIEEGTSGNEVLTRELEMTKDKLKQLEVENAEKSSEMESQISGLKAELTRVIEEGSSGNDALQTAERKLEQLKVESGEKMKQMEIQANDLTTQLNEAVSEIDNLKALIGDFETEKSKLQSIRDEKSKLAETLETKLEESVKLTEKYRIESELNEEKLLELEDECLQLRESCNESKCIIQKLDTIRSELNDLQREKHELERTFAQRCESHENEKTRAANKITELQTQIDELENLGSVSEERCHELEVRVTNLDKENAETETKLSQQLEIIEKKNLEIDNLKRTYDEIKNHGDNLVSQRDHEISKLSETCTNLIEEKRNLEECVLKTEGVLKERNEVNAALEAKLAQNETEIGALKTKLIDFEEGQGTEYEKLKEINVELENKYAELRDELKQRDEALKATEENFQTILEERNNHAEEISSKLDDLRRQLDESNRENEAAKEQHEELEKRLQQLDQMESKCRETESRVTELMENLKEMSAKHDEILNQKELEFANEIREKDQLIASLEEDIRVRSVQLDECLVVSEANTSGIAQELETSREKIEALTKENSRIKQQLDSAVVVESPFETSLLENVTLNNDEDYETRLKKLVKYFSAQMKTKEEEYEKELSDIKERYIELEQKLVYEKDQNVTLVEKRLEEQTNAIEEMREHFVAQIQEKDDLIQSLQRENNVAPKSDWDNNWEYEEEAAAAENVVKQSAKSETMSSNIQSVCANGTTDNRNNFGGDLSTGLEPTEYLYLRNILLEYMMGKEPVTLAKVIAAVLRFPKDLTSQILKREEARQHSTIVTHSGKW